ncbi:hypothetical protein [Sneathiella aquimaris]|uniref:hypothetical protein n=1 Tax=Sneathiella aquimaris TaxID=2599305 RepID=UPI00146CD626|nr:hypothetical protein [Sneathiella aquimaris]
MDEFSVLQLIGLFMAFFLVLPGFVYHVRRTGMNGLLKNVALWLGIAVVIALLYQYFGASVS